MGCYLNTLLASARMGLSHCALISQVNSEVNQYLGQSVTALFLAVCSELHPTLPLSGQDIALIE